MYVIVYKDDLGFKIDVAKSDITEVVNADGTNAIKYISLDSKLTTISYTVTKPAICELVPGENGLLPVLNKVLELDATLYAALVALLADPFGITVDNAQALALFKYSFGTPITEDMFKNATGDVITPQGDYFNNVVINLAMLFKNPPPADDSDS